MRTGTSAECALIQPFRTIAHLRTGGGREEAVFGKMVATKTSFRDLRTGYALVSHYWRICALVTHWFRTTEHRPKKDAHGLGP